MKKVVLTYGLIAGVIIAIMGWVNMDLCINGHIPLARGMLIGYASMVIALTTVFFGIKSYRDNYANGKITFWQGVKIGLLISAIGGVMYWAGAVVYATAHPGFEEKVMQKYKDYNNETMTKSGASQADIEKANEDAEGMMKLLENPLFFFVECLFEILPVGLVITLISAALLRRRELLPAAA